MVESTFLPSRSYLVFISSKLLYTKYELNSMDSFFLKNSFASLYYSRTYTHLYFCAAVKLKQMKGNFIIMCNKKQKKLISVGQYNKFHNLSFPSFSGYAFLFNNFEIIVNYLKYKIYICCFCFETQSFCEKGSGMIIILTREQSKYSV